MVLFNNQLDLFNSLILPIVSDILGFEIGVLSVFNSINVKEKAA